MDEMAEQAVQTAPEELPAGEQPLQAEVVDGVGEGGSGFARQARELVEQFPELKGQAAPEEVIRAAVEGEDLTAAYTRYALGQSRAEEQRLGRELDALRQNREAASRAPVRGVSGGAAVQERGSDPFLAGFDEE